MNKVSCTFSASCLVFLATVSCSLAASSIWSCAVNVSTIEFNVSRISGIWYETARFPETEVPACVKVSAPTTPIDGHYTLRMNYFNNVDKGWKNTTEDIVFTWNENTQNGTFELVYGYSPFSITVIFKLIATDYETLALVCGYSPMAPQINLIKVLTRHAPLNPILIEKINDLANIYNVGSLITWVEHSSRCNAASKTAASFLLLFVLVCGIQQVLNYAHLYI
ncbi:uncharacterized protein LOC129253329 [Anastrepha obliqua]|uniref:uncharacterized protein LOC129253329 n=1 Tax=Anastrepha obliqua TaxID=95512 RepID=UPI00240A444F|nr:uncharacterized protein LOC129253329 [Anastrepha obliqua]